ncbi:cytochrome c oxidase subunit II [Sorangium sp. So ce1151]|uniref:cytochrome c oxidase subunit II n=1 Tax=Sorangium sp. So ce1151 TaxID=3133332 RepID=UPI003F633B66
MNELLRQLLFLPEQRSSLAREIDGLHYFVIGVTMGGAVLITLIGGYFLLRYRRRIQDTARPHAGTVARPALFLETVSLFGLGFLFLTFWNIGTRQFVDLRTAPDDALDVYVTGKQWMWKFGYPEGESEISVLYVPVRRPVRLIMTSRDVIHSFFVPEFRIKQDVLPGRYTTAWFEASQPGAYPILCTEYCGTSHSGMRGQVIALDPADYERWLAGGAASTPAFAQEAAARAEEQFAAAQPTMPARGEHAAARHGCLRCHTLDGTQHVGPTWAGLYRSVVPLEDGGERVADEVYITESIMDPLAVLHRGFPAVMPSYLGQITPPDIAAMIELMKSIRDVPHGPVVPWDGGVSGGGAPAPGGVRP